MFDRLVVEEMMTPKQDCAPTRHTFQTLAVAGLHVYHIYRIHNYYMIHEHIYKLLNIHIR